MSRVALSGADHDLLLRLLRTPTVNPLEAGPGEPAAQLWAAQRDYARAAAGIGFVPIHHAAPDPAVLYRADVPAGVREHAAHSGFLAGQPSLVLRLGPALPVSATVMFNVHLDTVSGLGEVGFDGERFTGRGAIDAKGPAVALLAGVRAARAARPALGRQVAVLVQAVAGEEGGAMGTYGTRPLIEAGHIGRLNVFCEPTGGRYLTRSTASMTAAVEVRGQGAVDDRPDTGHNATVLLGFLAQHLASTLDGHPAGGRLCVAGLHTGDRHNRVYGTGRLLLNLSYSSAPAGAQLELAVAAAVRTGVEEFRRRFGATREFARTAADAATTVAVHWIKRGLPSLAGSDPWGAELLDAAGVARWPTEEPAFTCDAIWMHGVAGTSTVVLGPGCLAANNAHADGEFADLSDLDDFAGTVARLLQQFPLPPTTTEGQC